jgi:nicotinate-nucleotide pyrophosphorylase (carboxylating)
VYGFDGLAKETHYRAFRGLFFGVVAYVFPMTDHVEKLIDLALAEDIGSGDVTSEYFVPEDAQAKAMMLVKADGVVAGLKVAQRVFEKVDSSVTTKLLMEDGSKVVKGDYVMEICGSARSVLTGERVALNFMQRLSGIATKTALFVGLTEGTKANVLDTRKTTPGWRELEKYAVTQGGGMNHRMGLYDRAMVKDNHLVAEHDIDDIQAAIVRLKSEKPHVEVELEADLLEQVEAFLKLEGVDHILLDNMTNEQMVEAVGMRGDEEFPRLEASGGVNEDTIYDIARTGVDFISVGALTHSAVALDISLDFVEL